MKTKKSYSKIFTAGLVSTALFLSACQNNSQRGEGRPAGGNPTTPPNLEKTKLDANQKKYIQDIVKTVLYKDHLSALVQELSKGGKYDFEKLVQLKTWIIGPDILKDVSGELSKTTSGKQTVAKQKQYEIFIDSTALGKVEVAAQADIMKLEFFSSLYLLKNLDDAQFCEAVLDKFPETEDCESKILGVSPETQKSASRDGLSKKDSSKDEQVKELEDLAKNYQDQHADLGKASALNNSDKSNISNLLSYIKEEADGLTATKLIVRMKKLNFDVRIFKLTLKGQVRLDVSKEILNKNDVNNSMTSEQIEGFFTQVEALNGKELSCTGLVTKGTSKCLIEVRRQTGEKSKTLEFAIADSAKNVLARAQIHQPKVLTAQVAEGATEGQMIYVLPLTSFDMTEKTEGAEYRMNYLIYSHSMTSDREGASESGVLEGILSVPGTLKTVRRSDLTGKVACVGQKVEAKDLATDVLFASATGTQFSYLNRFTAPNWSPQPPCW